MRGAVLLVALIFLILMSLLAIGASSGSLLQQKMVGATRSSQLALMSGDAALRGAEWNVWSTATAVGKNLLCDAGSINAGSGCVKFDATSPLYATGGAVATFRKGDNSWLALSGPKTYTGPGGAGYTAAANVAATGSPNVAANPQYIIEDLGLEKPPGAGSQHESGVTGTTQGGPGNVNVHIYRITARATGGTKSTVRVVESTFDAQSNN